MYVEVSMEKDFVTFSCIRQIHYILSQKYFSFNQQTEADETKRSIFIRLLLLFSSLELSLF